MAETSTLNKKMQFLVFVSGGTCSYPFALNNSACGISNYGPGVVIAVRCWYRTLDDKERCLF